MTWRERLAAFHRELLWREVPPPAFYGIIALALILALLALMG